jgi:hypothetical protein
MLALLALLLPLLPLLMPLLLLLALPKTLLLPQRNKLRFIYFGNKKATVRWLFFVPIFGIAIEKIKARE